MQKRLLFLLFCLVTAGNIFCYTHLLTIMLDPAGDARHAGRLIEDSFERGLTLEFAEQLKRELEDHHRFLRVILTRFPGETLEPLQNAAFANRLNVDLYLSVHFYYQQQGISPIYIYQLLYNPVTDFWQKLSDSITFYSFDKAYLFNIKTSRSLGTAFCKSLNEQASTNCYSCKSFLGMPFKPLVGIRAPALGIEIGLKNKEDWLRFVQPIAQALFAITQSL